MSATPWHLLARLERGRRYRLNDGSTVVYYKRDGTVVQTSAGLIRMAVFLNELLDRSQFEEPLSELDFDPKIPRRDRPCSPS